MELIKGKGEELPLAGWGIAVMGERLLLGKMRLEGHVLILGPVYDYTSALVRVRDGIEWQCAVSPALGFISITELPIPGGTLIVHIETLHPSERKQMASKVLAFDEILRSVRLAASGISVVQNRPRQP